MEQRVSCHLMACLAFMNVTKWTCATLQGAMVHAQSQWLCSTACPTGERAVREWFSGWPHIENCTEGYGRVVPAAAYEAGWLLLSGHLLQHPWTSALAPVLSCGLPAHGHICILTPSCLVLITSLALNDPGPSLEYHMNLGTPVLKYLPR